MNEWYLCTMSEILGVYKTKRDALYELFGNYKCHRRSYGYSISLKDECDTYWHADAFWLFKGKDALLAHGFGSQYNDFINIAPVVETKEEQND